MELDLCKEGPWVLTTKNCGIAQEPSLFQCDFLSHWVLKSIERKAFIMFRVKKLESGYKLGSGSKLGQILDPDQNTKRPRKESFQLKGWPRRGFQKICQHNPLATEMQINLLSQLNHQNMN